MLTPTTVTSPLDIGQLQNQSSKILGAFELIGALVESAIEKENLSPTRNHEHDAILNHVELVASTFADVTCHMLEGLLHAD